MIYILEDDDSIRNFVVYALSSSEFEARGFDRPSALWAALENETPDIFLLDIMLPEEDGIEVLKKLRARSNTANIPAIMLTAKDSEYDKVVGLDAGADDYISKPFGIMELIARIKAILRRSAKVDSATLTFDILSIDEKAHCVQVCGENVPLTLKEYELLLLLAKNVGTVMTRDVILEKIWGYDYDGENRTVDVHVRTLRQKLGSAGGLIDTVRGVGYRLMFHTTV